MPYRSLKPLTEPTWCRYCGLGQPLESISWCRSELRCEGKGGVKAGGEGGVGILCAVVFQGPLSDGRKSIPGKFAPIAVLSVPLGVTCCVHSLSYSSLLCPSLFRVQEGITCKMLTFDTFSHEQEAVTSLATAGICGAWGVRP